MCRGWLISKGSHRAAHRLWAYCDRGRVQKCLGTALCLGKGVFGCLPWGEGALFVELAHSVCSIAWDVCTLTNLALMNLFSVIAIHLLHTSTCVVILLTFITY